MNYDVQQLNSKLMEGDTGSDVIILQDKLKLLGYYDSSITGSFDAYTKTSVTNFQKRNNLSPNGIVGRETWQLLYRFTMNPIDITNEKQSRPVLRLGSTGSDVIELQTLLTNLLYYTGNIDGNFGLGTEGAVKRFQANNRLTPDGIVGRDTWSALSTLYAPLAICEEDNNQPGIKTYTVVAGDSLWSIANRFNTTVEEIKRLNNLTSDIIFVGQTLLVPSPVSDENMIYTVVAGDSLWKIAQRFNTTVDAIKSLNHLTSDSLYIGQQLKIPTKNQESKYYIVVAGDSLWKIAQRFNTTVDTLKRLNHLTSDNLTIGQQLIIP